MGWTTAGDVMEKELREAREMERKSGQLASSTGRDGEWGAMPVPCFGLS